MKKKILGLLLLASMNGHCADMVGSDLVNYFSSTCRTQGEYTRQALDDARSLISILENIKNDNDCVTVSGSISQLSNLESKLFQLQNHNSLDVEIAKLSAQENQLRLQLNSTTDEYALSEINSTIRDIQIQKVSLMTQIDASNELQGRDVKDIYAKIISTTNNLYQSISSNHRCLNKNPGILPAITSFTSAVGSAALMIEPAFGLGLSAVTDFIGTTIESLRHRKYNKMIRKISDSGMALEGYKCVLESLSQRWCSLQDAEEVLKVKAKVRRQKNNENKELSAIRLNDRDVPLLLSWLNDVRTGVPAATTADAERQKDIFNREASVRAANALGNGIISQNRPLYNSSKTDEEKYSVLKTIVTGLTGTSCGGGYSSRSESSNPLADIHSNDYAPYYLLGLPETPKENGFPIRFCEFNPFLQWPSGTFTPDLFLVQEKYNDWVDTARRRVNQELTLVLQPDTLQVLSSAYDNTSNKWKYSPVSSMDNIIEFLENHKPQQFTQDFFNNVYTETLDKLKAIRIKTEDGVIGTISTDSALKEIFDLAELEYGVVVIETRLKMIIRIAIQEYLDKVSQSDFSQQLLASESFMDVLSKIQGTKNLASIAADIKRAKPIAIGNMNAFVDIFSENIERIL